MNNKQCIIIGVAGGTGSGKTTFTDRLKNEFGNNITVLHHDNYYKSQSNLSTEERKNANYDHPNQLETKLLIEHLQQLRMGKSIECPIYDFTQHTRSDKTCTIVSAPVILVEGILIFVDEELRDMFDIKIFVEGDADERILRRAKRDVKERGRDIYGVIEQYLSTVKPMHNLYVEPTKKIADIIINGGKNDVAYDLIKWKIEGGVLRSIVDKR